MNFEWDEDKSNACFRTRGFDFAYAAFAFADPDPGVRQFDALILEKVHVFNNLSVSRAVVVMARFGTFCVDLDARLGLS